jgi:hypothetical protein
VKSPDDAHFQQWQENPEPPVGTDEEIIVKEDTTRSFEAYFFRGKGTFNWISIDADSLAEVEP